MLLIEFDQNKPFALQVWCIVCFCISELIFFVHLIPVVGEYDQQLCLLELFGVILIFHCNNDSMNVAPEKVRIV